jgi:hypothetical protein
MIHIKTTLDGNEEKIASKPNSGKPTHQHSQERTRYMTM